MSLEFELPLVSFIFLIIINIVYFSKERVDLPENKPYKIILICSLIQAFIDTIIHLICSANSFDIIVSEYYPLFNFLNKILIGLFAIIFSSLLCYTLMITYESVRKNPMPLYIAMIILNVFFLIIGLFTNITLVDMGSVTNVKGSTIALCYIIVAILLVSSLVIALRNIRKMDKRYLPIFFVFVILGILFLFTIIAPGMIIYDLALALMCYIMYFTIENPDLNMVKELEYQKEHVLESKNISNRVINTISDSLSDYVNKLSVFGYKKINYDDKDALKKEIVDMQKFSLSFVKEVDSLLELSRTQSEGFEVLNSNYEPKQMIREINDLFNTKDKKIEVIVNSSDNVPPVLYGDPLKIKQGLLHLYNGIVRISDLKNIDFNFSYLVVGSLCRFKVNTEIELKTLTIDYSNDLIDKVIDFEILERILNLLNGKFNMTIVNGDKLKFEIVLDQKYVDGYYMEENVVDYITDDIDYIDLFGKKILIIDDDSERASELTKILIPYNIDITISYDYDSTVKECSDKVFDIIIIDDIITDLDIIKNYLLIDNSNGLLKIMTHIEYDVPRIIMVTPNTMGYENKYLDDGFDGVITKPINKSNLDRVIRDCFELKDVK